MTLQQAFELSKKAKERGYSTCIHQGKVQFQIISYKKNGTSEVTPTTGWLDYDKAVDIIDGE